jgi:hypothetical protein
MIELGATEDGRPAIATFSGGHKAVELGAIGNGGALSLYNQQGVDVITLAATDGGEGTLVAHDAKGASAIGLAVSKDGTGHVVTFDSSGRPRASWPQS